MKLTKKQINERDAVSRKLAETRQDLESVVEEFNSGMEELWEKVTESQTTYNEALDAARQWVSDQLSDLNEYIDGKSEKWQDGERGQATQTMRDEYDAIDLDDIELEKPDPLEFDVEDHSELINQLPEEADA